MKSNFNHTFLHRALGAGLCVLMLSGLSISSVYAQTEGTDTVAVRRIAKAKKSKQYPTKTVTGKITDNATGDPMGGVRIQALGLEAYSTLTEEDGSFKLDIPTFSDALYVYAEGYNPTQVAVKDGVADASLLTTQFNGFYTDGTSITSQRKVTLDQTSSMSIDEDIERKLGGDIRTIKRNGLPGIGSFMNIRGVNSLNANTQPILIVDGNIIDSQYDRTTMHEGFYNNILLSLDPENVESVQVIKNATALYGAKGANGALIINTKRGKSMATKINVRVYGGAELTPNKLDVLSGDQYTAYLSDMISTVKNNTSSSLGSYTFLDKSPSNYYRKVFDNNTDWQKDMYRTAMTQNYKISVEGGDEIGMYDLSLGYTKSESIGKGTDFDRLNLRFNTDIKVFSKVNTELDIAYSQNSYHIMDNDWSESYDMQNIGSTNVLGLIQAPFISPYAYYYDENATDAYSSDRLRLSNEYAGKYAANGGTLMQNPFNFSNMINTGSNVMNEALRNPYWILQNGEGNNKNYAQTTQINLNVKPTYQVTKTFSISDRFNFNLNRGNEKYFLPVNGTTQYYLQDLGYVTSVQKTFFSKATTLQNDLRLNWENTYGAHHVNVYGGWRCNNYSCSNNYMQYPCR